LTNKTRYFKNSVQIDYKESRCQCSYCKTLGLINKDKEETGQFNENIKPIFGFQLRLICLRPYAKKKTIEIDQFIEEKSKKTFFFVMNKL